MSEVDTPILLQVLKPLAVSKPDVARRLRTRIAAVLDYARAHGWRAADNPAAGRGHMHLLLPASPRLERHHPALRWQDRPAFWTRLANEAGHPAACLRFVILTAARSGEARAAHWAEIDLSAKLWTVPAGRTKTHTGHQVPLSDAAIAVLEQQPRGESDTLVFPGLRRRRSSGQIADQSLTDVIKRVRPGSPVTCHGFRSSFRTWAAEATDAPREIAEATLGHAIGSRGERAYQRSSMFRKRAALMVRCTDFCTGRRRTAKMWRSSWRLPERDSRQCDKMPALSRATARTE